MSKSETEISQYEPLTVHMTERVGRSFAVWINSGLSGLNS